VESIINKLSSYNLFNYLLPGVIFTVIIESITSFKFLTSNLELDFFIVYFIGLLISRIGSLFIEPILKKVSFVKFAEYSDYLEASKVDKEIITLSEANNMYRTFISLFFVVAILKLYDLGNFSSATTISISLLIIFTLFLFGYRKQTSYITKRINNHKKEK